MRFTLKAALGLALMAAPAPSLAAWLRASSDHFIIYSDTSPEAIRDYAARLERYDQGLRRLFLPDAPRDQAHRSNRLRIYVLANGGEVSRLCGKRCNNVVGFYRPRAGGSTIFTPRRAGDASPAELNSQTVLFHEYAHHFMYANFTAAYPAWYVEGFAEFNSTASLERNGTVGFGRVANHRAYALRQGKPLTVEELVDTPERPRKGRDREALYGRGWLFTHFLTFSKARKGQLGKYLEALNRGVPSVEAARSAFGDLAALNAELVRYMDARLSFGYLDIPDAPADRIQVEQLSAGQAAMMPIHIRSTRGISRVDALALLPLAQRTASAFPADAVVQAELAEAEFDAGNLDGADAAADRALQADPKSMAAHLYKGRVAVMRAATSHSRDAETWRAARQWFLKANRLDNDAAEPLILYYDSFAAARVPPTDNAVLGLGRAYELAPEDIGVRMRFALQALRADKPRLARAALTRIAYDPHVGTLAERAGQAIEAIDRGDNDAARRIFLTKESSEDAEPN